MHETTPRCIPTAFLQYFVNPSWHVDADADDDDDDGGELKASGLRPSEERMRINIYVYGCVCVWRTFRL